MAKEAQPQWEGKITTSLNNTSAEEVWPFFQDFCSLNKWLPSIDMCHKVDGIEGKPGLVRYCASTIPPQEDGGIETVKWCHEKLLDIDVTKKLFSYEILENNIGFKSYKSTLKVVPMNDNGQHGCRIEWLFVADPVDGMRCEDLVAYLDYSLQGMAKNIEKALVST